MIKQERPPMVRSFLRGVKTTPKMLRALKEWGLKTEEKLSYWQKRCLAAEAYIEESPCDHDARLSQFKTYEK